MVVSADCMTSGVRAKHPDTPRFYTWLGLLAWVGVLAFLAFRNGRQPIELPMAGLRSGRALVQLARTVMMAGFASFASFLPVGFLCVYSLPPREKWAERTLKVGLPSLGMSLLLALAINGFHSPGLAALNLVTLLLPGFGCFMGWWAAMAWRRGRTAALLFVPQLMLVALLIAAGVGVLIHRAIESTPLELQVPKVTSAEKRRLYSLFSGKNPLRLEGGKTVELSLTAPDINLLLAWGLPLADTARSAVVEIDQDRGQLRASVQIPGTSRFINVAAEGTFGFSKGQLQVRLAHLRVGRVELPTRLVSAFIPELARFVMEDARIKPMVAAVRSIELRDGSVTLSYSHGRPPKGFIASLFHDEGSERIDFSAVRAQILNLLASRSSISGTTDERFGKAVQTAFRYARERASADGAVAANRSALLALGIALGHPRVETLIGSFLDENTRDALTSGFSGTTLRGRDDWPKHFFVSAALTIVAAGNVSDATGLFKEEKDSGGGSGFSFADLLADRSGTTFAQVATRDESSARALQARLNRSFDVNDYFPPADGLPEGLQDLEFQHQMGGVGGEGYNRLIAEIERRVAACAAYRASGL